MILALSLGIGSPLVLLFVAMVIVVCCVRKKRRKDVLDISYVERDPYVEICIIAVLSKLRLHFRFV